MRESSFTYKTSDSSGTWIFNPLIRRIHILSGIGRILQG